MKAHLVGIVLAAVGAGPAGACEPTGDLAETLDGAAHIFAGTVVVLGDYDCELSEPAAQSWSGDCITTITVQPETSYDGRLAPPGPVPVRFSFSSRSYAPAAGDPLPRIASGLEVEVLVISGPGTLVDGVPTLTAIEDGCGPAHVLLPSDPRIAAAASVGRLIPNPSEGAAAPSD